MKKALFLLFTITLFLTGSVLAQVVGEFRSVASGNWNSVNTWETFNGTIWVTPAASFPNSITAIATVQAGHTLTMSAPAQVKTLNLDGIVTTTSTNTLTIYYTGSIVGGSATAYIDGPLNYQITTGVNIPKTINIPLGKGSVGRPVAFKVAHNRANLITYAFEMFNAVPPAYILPATLSSVSSVRYYTIARTNITGLTSNCNLTLLYDTDDAVGTNNSLLRIVRDSGTAWLSLGGVGSAPVSGSITSVTAALLTPSLSLAAPTNNVFTLGSVSSIISGNAGVAGATLSYFDGTAKTVTSAANGTYSIYVPGGWSGTITPSLQYYNFTPASLNFTNVAGNLTLQNFTAVSTFTDFRSVGPGSWSDPLTWEGWDGSVWVPSSVPTGAAGSILIRDVDEVTLDVPISLEAGCTLTNEGILKVNSTLTVKANALMVNIGSLGNPGSTLNVYGTFEHRQDGGMIGVAGSFGESVTNFYAGSKILVTGVVYAAPSVPWWFNFSQMIWDCPNQADDAFLYINSQNNSYGKDDYSGFGNLTVLNSNSHNIFMFSGQGRSVGNIVVDGPTSKVTAFTHSSSGIEYAFFSYFSSLTVQNGGQFYTNIDPGSPGKDHVTIQIHHDLIVSSNSVLGNYGYSNYSGPSFNTIGFTTNYTHNLDLSGQVPAPGLDAQTNNLNFFINGNTVTLASPISANSLELFGTGKIVSNGNLITMVPGGNISGASAANFTDGPVAFQVATTDPTTMTFPVGKGTIGRPVTLTVTQDAVTPTTYTAEMLNPPVPTNALSLTLGSVSTVRYYNISRSTGANVTTANVLMNYSTDDGVGTDNSLLRIAKADGAGNWVDLGGTGTAATTGTITSTNNFTDFTGSDFILGFTLVSKIIGNAGIAGATFTWNDAGVHTTTSDVSGNYSISVPYGWSGTVTPSKTGYSFAPVNNTYTNVTTDQTAQDYVATPITYTISGNTGTLGVTLSWTDGTAKTTTSDAGGAYSFTVSYSWSGTVTPTLTGYTFAPANRVYSNVLADQLTQNYVATPIVYTISGNAGIAGAGLSYTDGTAKTATADGTGLYSFTVSYNWSGTVTPFKAGYAFSPVNISYTNVVSNQSAQNYVATPTSVPAGLVSYWKLNEASGSFYADLSGINNGNGNTSPTAVAGQVGGAQQFDGTTTQIDVPANPTFDFAANGNFSVECWYKGANTPASIQVIIGRYISQSSAWYMSLNAPDGRVRFNMVSGGQGAVVFGSVITDGSWHHVTVTRNGTNGELKIYVDGSLQGSSTTVLSMDISSATAKINIGSFNGNFILDGSLDEVAIHNVELTPADVWQHYTNGVHGVDYYASFAPVITSVAPLNGIVGQLYSYTVKADGYPAPTYSLTTSPAGMTINAATGLIQWIPVSASYANVTVQASNGVSPPSTQSFIIVVPVPPVIPTGLVAYWKLNEASGTIYADLSGINNGTGNSSPTAVTGQIGGAQQFNGTTQIDVPASPSLDFAANGNFSVECWYKGANTPASIQVIIGRYISQSSAWYMSLNAPDGRVRFNMVSGGQGAVVFGSVITDGSWHHVTVTRNGTNGELKIYVDGSLQGSSTTLLSMDISSATAKINIGSFNRNFLLDGSLDEVAIHNVELTPADVWQHYTNGIHGVDYYASFAPVITSVAPLNGVVGQLYSYTVKADGYPAPTYSLTTVPAGMTINAATGLIQWIPSASGNVNVTVEANNGVNPVSSQSFTIVASTPPVIPTGMVAYWKLDELTGNTYIDFTGINNGTGNPSPTTVTGQIGGAQQFNGTTQIDVPASPSLDFAANGNFSVECWYKGANTPASIQVIIGRYISQSSAWYMSLNAPDGRVRFNMVSGGQGAVVFGSVITDGSWHHVTVTRNGTNGELKIYVDGILQGSSTTLLSMDISSTTTKINIGSFNGNFKLDGSLDDVAVYNTELLPAEILQHYNNGLTGGVLAVPLAQNSTLNTTDLDNVGTQNLDLSAYAFRNVEIRIKGNVSREALATLYDLQGRVVRIQKLEEGSLNIMPTPGIKNAIYILSVIDNGKKQTFKIPVNAY